MIRNQTWLGRVHIDIENNSIDNNHIARVNIFLQSSCRLNISGMEEEYKNYDFINSTTNLKKSEHCQKTTLVYQH